MIQWSHILGIEISNSQINKQTFFSYNVIYLVFGNICLKNKWIYLIFWNCPWFLKHCSAVDLVLHAQAVLDWRNWFQWFKISSLASLFMSVIWTMNNSSLTFIFLLLIVHSYFVRQIIGPMIPLFPGVMTFCLIWGSPVTVLFI